MMVVENLLPDLRYGGRMLFRNAAFTAISVFALALGIGIHRRFHSIQSASETALGCARSRSNGEPGIDAAVRRERFAVSYPITRRIAINFILSAV